MAEALFIIDDSDNYVIDDSNKYVITDGTDPGDPVADLSTIPNYLTVGIRVGI